MAPLTSRAFNINSATINTFIVNIIAGNDIEEAKYIFKNHTRIRMDCFTLKNHYKGVVINARDIFKVEDILDHMYLSSNKPPHTWRDNFENKLNWDFDTHGR